MVMSRLLSVVRMICGQPKATPEAMRKTMVVTPSNHNMVTTSALACGHVQIHSDETQTKTKLGRQQLRLLVLVHGRAWKQAPRGVIMPSKAKTSKLCILESSKHATSRHFDSVVNTNFAHVTFHHFGTLCLVPIHHDRLFPAHSTSFRFSLKCV
jgi:hypothetical protein